MPARARPVPALYVPSALPLSVPVPLSRTELYTEIQPLSRQDLTLLQQPKKSAPAHRPVPYTKPPPGVKPSSRSGTVKRSTPKGTTPGVRFTNNRLTPGRSGSEGAPGPIKKPDGEVGRPGRGGYSLNTDVKPLLPSFDEIKEFVKNLVYEELDTHKAMKFQSRRAVISIHEASTKQFPELEGFVKAWPVTDMISSLLKTSSASYRKAQGLSARDDGDEDTPPPPTRPRRRNGP